jgi:predicted deacetylase
MAERMQTKYLIRLDDACPTMDANRWQRVEALLDRYSVKPMVGIIPKNQDPQQEFNPVDANFWDKVKKWEKKGWAIALHGYDHCYLSNDAGINPLWHRSEFAGVPLEVQQAKIANGIAILNDNGIMPDYFFAPSHTFDENTLKALKECSSIRIISDTIATKPYVENEFIFIPQVGGHCTTMHVPGVWTFCLHPSVMSDDSFANTEFFLQKHRNEIISFADLDLKHLKPKSFLDKLLSAAYFSMRKIRGLK